MAKAATPPSKVAAQFMPSLTNIVFAKSGKPAPQSERRTLLPAFADAAL